MDILPLLDRIKLHEGFRPKPYLDTENILTIGYGTNIADGISREEGEFLLKSRVNIAVRAAQALFNNFAMLSQARQEVLVEMAYQLGGPRLAGFKDMIAAVEADDPHTVVVEMLDSKWAKQTPSRALELAERYKQG